MDDKPIQLTLAERRASSVARALRLTGRPDSSLEHVEAQIAQATESDVLPIETRRQAG